MVQDGIEEIKKIVKRMKRIKTMTEEFNFDELLEEIEPEVKNEKSTKQADQPESKEQPKDAESILDDSLLSELDNLDDSKPGNNDISRVINNEIENPDSEIDYQKIINELEAQIAELQGTVKAFETIRAEEAVEVALPNLDFDFKDETAAFLKEWAEIEIEAKEFNERKKELKKDYEEQGVHTKEAIKAWKEYQKQFKETPEEAQEIENVKRLINENENLAITAKALSE